MSDRLLYELVLVSSWQCVIFLSNSLCMRFAKQYSRFVAGSLFVIILAWCSQKATMQVSFDHYSLQRDTNQKIYTTVLSSWSSNIRYEAQQVTTGIANSLVISQIPLASGTLLKNVVSLNTDQLAKKLVNYKWGTPNQQNISCNGARLTGYLTTFSYTLDNQTFHIYQYYFIEKGTMTLYLISFQANNSKDISATASSIKSLTCK